MCVFNKTLLHINQNYICKCNKNFAFEIQPFMVSYCSISTFRPVHKYSNRFSHKRAAQQKK